MIGRTTHCTWIAGCGRPAAWLSLDEGDTDPTRFLTYLVAALQPRALIDVEEIGASVVGLLQSPQQPATFSFEDVATRTDVRVYGAPEPA
jgi:LuxR family transcriptional regulator, maltose regulon positive regulatory protein